jgi:rod shape-determining protein MreD
MSGRVKIFLLSIFMLAVATILQSTLISYIAIGGVKPDLSLIILVFISVRTGSLIGQFSGFTSGLIEDFISLPPLGFFSLIRTIIGFLYGLIRRSFYIDPLFVPILFVIVASLIKGILIWLVALIFSVSSADIAFFGAKFWIEIGYNALLAPFIFALLNLIKIFKIQERGER